MVITPRAIGFSLTEAICTHVESRVRSALQHLKSSVFRVTVRLNDVNGDHGGVDKRCNIVALLRGRRVVVADATHCSLYSAIDAAADRIHRSVRRSETRHKGRERKGSQRPGSLWQVKA